MHSPRAKKKNRGRKPAGDKSARKRVASAGSPGLKNGRRARSPGAEKQRKPAKRKNLQIDQKVKKQPKTLPSITPTLLERKPGRPTTYSEEIAEKICELIKKVGMHPTPAAAKLGVPDSSLSQWRKDIPEFEERIRQAEAEHLEKRLEQVGTAISLEEKDAKTLRWFIERRFRAEFGANPEVQINNNISAPVVLTEKQLAAMQDRRRAALAGQQRKKE